MKNAHIVWTAAIFSLLCLACGQKPASIKVDPTRLMIYGIGKSASVRAEILDRKGNPIKQQPQMGWSSSNAKVAAVGGTGQVTTKGEGRAQIKVSVGEISSSVPVQVIDLAQLDVAPPSAHLVGPAGSTVQLVAVERNSKKQPVTIRPVWQSSDPKVATVDTNGLVRSLAPGRMTAYARLGDFEAAADILVEVRSISRVELRPQTALLHANDSQHFTVNAYDSDGKPMSDVAAAFSSSDPAVVTVNGAGVADARAKGTAVVTATVGDQSATATVIVN